MKIKKAILTAAGKGTRFFPVAVAYQKEMIPIMEKPQLQMVIEEIIEAGIFEIAVISKEGTNTFEEYMRDDDKLWKFLKDTGKESIMDSWLEIKEKADFTYLTQKDSDPYGNGTPIILAKDFVQGQDFLACFGDDFFLKDSESSESAIQQIYNYYEKYDPVGVMATMKVKREEISKYGCYDYYTKEESDIPYHAKKLIEKPAPEVAPSLNANTVRFILKYEVMEELCKSIKGQGGEIWLVDAVDRLIQKGRTVIAPVCEGVTWLPCGSPELWLKANITVALRNPQYRDSIMEFIKGQV